MNVAALSHEFPQLAHDGCKDLVHRAAGVDELHAGGLPRGEGAKALRDLGLDTEPLELEAVLRGAAGAAAPGFLDREVEYECVAGS